MATDNFRERVEAEVRRLRYQVTALDAYLAAGVDAPFVLSEIPVSKRRTTVPVRRRKSGPRGYPPLSGDQVEKVVALYHAGNGTDKIATCLQVNREQVRRALRDQGVKMRGRAEGVRLAMALRQERKAAQAADQRKNVSLCVGCNQKFKADALDRDSKCWACR